MGKGDMRSRRGKIVRRTHGNVRPKHALKKHAPKATQPAEPKR